MQRQSCKVPELSGLQLHDLHIEFSRNQSVSIYNIYARI